MSSQSSQSNLLYIIILVIAALTGLCAIFSVCGVGMGLLAQDWGSTIGSVIGVIFWVVASGALFCLAYFVKHKALPPAIAKFLDSK